MNLNAEPSRDPDKNGYLGVSPEYANAANDTDRPMSPTEDYAEQVADSTVVRADGENDSLQPESGKQGEPEPEPEQSKQGGDSTEEQQGSAGQASVSGQTPPPPPPPPAT